MPKEVPTLIDLWNPPCIELYKSLRKAVAKSPPLGLAYIAAYMEKFGFKDRVKIVDSFALDYTWTQIERNLSETKAKYIGITCLTTTLVEVSRISRMIKTLFPEKIVIIGGSHPTAVPEITLKRHPEFDYLILGEGEISFHELVVLLEKENKPGKIEEGLKKIQGLAFRDSSYQICINPRKFIENLEEIPLPAYHLLPMDRYRAAAKFPRYERYGAIITARGCPYDCSFCAARVICGKKLRKRSIDSINEELDLLVRKFGVQQIEILDSTFTIDSVRAKKIAFDLRKRNLKWLCNGRVNEISLNLLQFFHNAGCEAIEYGFESADFAVLKKMKKNITLDQMKKAIRWANQSRIMVSGAFMIGNLGDSHKTIKKTISFALHENIDFLSLAIFTPYPGTTAYEEALELGLVDKSFEDYKSPKHSTPVIHLENLSQRDLKHYWFQSTIKFYLRKKFIFQFIKNIARNYRMIKMIFPFFFGVISEIFSR